MKILIIGTNRAEYSKIKPKDYDKHFFEIRRQLYKAYPDGLTRCIVTEYDRRKHDDEYIVYKENSIVPYHTRNQQYTMGKIISEIDEHKLMTSKSTFGSMRLMMKQATDRWKQLKVMLPILVAGIILLYAVLS